MPSSEVTPEVAATSGRGFLGLPADSPDDGSVEPTDRRPADPADVLEARLRRFELRLYHGLLVGRVTLAWATFLVLAAAAVAGYEPHRAAFVWLVLAVWTAATTPFLWGRLNWARALPIPVCAEIAAFTLLVFVGAGTRPWHLLHSFVPLIFVSVFAGRGVGGIVAAAIVVALWSAHVIDAVWPSAPLENPLPALVPSSIVLAGFVLLSHARGLLEQGHRLVRAQRAASAAIESARRAAAADGARLLVHQQVYEQLAATARRVVSDAPRLVRRLGPPAGEQGHALLACTAEIGRTLGELDEGAGGTTWPIRTNVREELVRAVARTEPLGAAVHLDVADGTSVPLEGEAALAFRRLITEAVGNARKHGSEPIAVRSRHDGLWVDVENRGARAPLERPGGQGLTAMRRDAEALGASFAIAADDGTVTVQIGLRGARAVDAAAHPEVDQASLVQTLRHEREAYERDILAGRLLFAVLTAVTIQLRADQHRSLLPVLTLTSLLLIAWNAFLVVKRKTVSRLVWRRPRLVWIDAGLITALMLVQGGMASPWMPLSMGSLMVLGLVLGARGSASLVALFAFATVVGWGFVLLLPVDDAGAQAQELPVGWLLNTFVFAAVATIASGIGWLFRRVGEAAAEYQSTVDLRSRVEREAALANARAETSRELHASLQQYVGAALVRIGALSSEVEGSDRLGPLESDLLWLRDALRTIVDDLRSAAPQGLPALR